jgi:hypothetical protein
MHRAWGPPLSSPNAALALKETARSGQAVSYRLYASGLPLDGNYSLVSWPVTERGPAVVLTGVTLNASGLAICAGAPGDCGSPDKPNDPIDLKLQPIMGEPFRVALISSTDPKLKAFAKIVPNPNQVIDKGCSLQSVLLLPGAAEVLIEGSGFAANADLTIELNFLGERHKQKVKADAEGVYSTVLLPVAPGRVGGDTELRVKSAACNPVLTFHWGK